MTKQTITIPMNNVKEEAKGHKDTRHVDHDGEKCIIGMHGLGKEENKTNNTKGETIMSNDTTTNTTADHTITEEEEATFFSAALESIKGFGVSAWDRTKDAGVKVWDFAKGSWVETKAFFTGGEVSLTTKASWALAFTALAGLAVPGFCAAATVGALAYSGFRSTRLQEVLTNAEGKISFADINWADAAKSWAVDVLEAFALTFAVSALWVWVAPYLLIAAAYVWQFAVVAWAYPAIAIIG